MQSTAVRDRRWFPTLVRYGLVGIFSNGCGYGLYVLVTCAGVPPLVAMSLLYAAGALIGFIGNKRWAFSHEGKALPSLMRYWIAHSIGFCLNFSMLYVFVDCLGYPHQVIQAIAIFVVAGFLFVMFRFFVFPHNTPRLPS